MNDDDSPSPIATEMPRPRCRFGHFSTWLIITFAFIVLLFANIPGEFNRISPPTEWDVDIQHGWPWTFLQRRVDATPKVRPAVLWRIGDEPKTFHPVAAMGNLAIGTSILAVVGLLFEWRRSRRHRFFQVTLWEWLVGVLLLAVGSATWAWLLNETDRQAAAAFVISDANMSAQWESPLPDWWTSIEPAPGNPRPGYIVAIVPVTYDFFIDPYPAADPPLLLRSLQQFPQLRILCITSARVGTKDWSSLENLATCSELQFLQLFGLSLNDTAVDSIARVSSLVDLDLRYNNITDAGLKKLQALKRLKHLNLMGNDVSVEAMEALQQALPGLEITHDRMPPPKNGWRISP